MFKPGSAPIRKDGGPHVNTTVSRNITTKLLRRIINGTYAGGSKLPTERQLMEEFGVTRSVIREALKRVEALGYLSIRQGSGIFVETAQNSEIDIIYLSLFKDDGSIDKKFLRDLVDFHFVMVRTVVPLAAQRITKRQLAELRRLAQDRSARHASRDALADNFLAVAVLIVNAAHNKYFDLLYSTLLRITYLFQGMAEVFADRTEESQRFFESLTEAFESGDSATASNITSAILDAIYPEYLATVERLTRGAM